MARFEATALQLRLFRRVSWEDEEDDDDDDSLRINARSIGRVHFQRAPKSFCTGGDGRGAGLARAVRNALLHELVYFGM